MVISKKKTHQLWYTNNKTENILSRKHISVYNSLVFAVNLNEKKNRRKCKGKYSTVEAEIMNIDRMNTVDCSELILL